jgi:DNA (cytosine-5)-methyltransferase 1
VVEGLKAVSLFSGAGGLDSGLRQAGFDIVLAGDLDPICSLSHNANFPTVPFHFGSISDLTVDIASKLSRGETDGPIDLLAGGPPCPPFSKSRFYLKNKPRALEDPVGWQTIAGYLEVLRFLRPRAFVLENVPGLAYAVHQEALLFILDAAKAAGYRCDWRILNAADYGVPQIRQRLFIIGTRDATFQWPEPTHAQQPQDGLFTMGLPRWVTAGEAIGDLDTEENASEEGHFAGGKHHDLLLEVPPGENYLHFTAERGYRDPKFLWRSRYWSFLLKLSPDLPSWTIQAKRSNNMGPFHWRNRILRIPEIMRLQTFPDEWVLAGTVEQQWRQSGNAVPPVLGLKLGLALRQALRSPALTDPVATAV